MKSTKPAKNLDTMISMLRRIDSRLVELSEKVSSLSFGEHISQMKSIDSREILTLPASLQKTALALVRLGGGTAERVAERTKRSRAVESLYLNQLVNLGYAKKERTKRTVYFSAR